MAKITPKKAGTEMVAAEGVGAEGSSARGMAEGAAGEAGEVGGISIPGMFMEEGPEMGAKGGLAMQMGQL